MYSLKSNEEFLEEIYRIHAKRISLYCKKLLRGHYTDATEECVQNTFLHAGQHASKLKMHPNIEGWLYRTSRNQVNNVFRRCYIQQKYEVRFHCDLAQRLTCNCPLIDEVLFSPASINRSVDEIMNKLNSRELELYRDYFKHHLSILQLSEKYNVSRTAVTSRIHRLRKKIRHLLQEAL
ncbi:RNA polymerase sigma factor [Paenibacillus agaridevorans]|uniref:RNA polymerase sigma factor n=1 Tax=Paenibacillus agaridevorans TaxID=171404 RepID=UPI001BE461F8|nr:sigma-70 family RNA polymerase sigma factor [Paenibacillus agaridevorans]